MQHICNEFPGVKALNIVSLDFQSGEDHSLVEENRAGNSTLMKVLIGVYKKLVKVSSLLERS